MSARKNLNFFRLLDEDDRLSLTNISLLVAIARLIVTRPSAVDLGVLVLCMLAYVGKKVLAHVQAKAKSEHAQALQLVQTQVKTLEQRLNNWENAKAVKGAIR